MDDTAETSAQPRGEMPRYQCHKQVWALKIKAIEQAPANQERQWPSGDWLLMPEEAGYAPIVVGHDEYVLRCKPQAGGYYVVYDDGYTSYSPAKAFEDGYTLAAAGADPIEREIAAKGKTAPRITPADIEANIVREHYFVGGDGIYGAAHKRGDNEVQTFGQSMDLLTFCILELRNGFTVTGESACVSPENFDAEIGRKIARANAVEKVWPLMGYELKERLWSSEQFGGEG